MLDFIKKRISTKDKNIVFTQSTPQPRQDSKAP